MCAGARCWPSIFADIDWKRQLSVLRGETTKSRKTRFVSDGRFATPDGKAHFAPVSTGPVPRSSADAFAVSTIEAAG